MPFERLGPTSVGAVLLYLALLAATLIPVWVARPLVDACQIRHAGVLTAGTITHQRVQVGRKSPPAYFVAVAFTPSGAAPVHTWAEVAEEAYGQLPPGSPVTVRYLPERPETFALEQYPTPLWGWGASLALSVTVLGLAWFAALRHKPPGA